MVPAERGAVVSKAFEWSSGTEHVLNNPKAFGGQGQAESGAPVSKETKVHKDWMSCHNQRIAH